MTQGNDPNNPPDQGGYRPPPYGGQPPDYGSQPPDYGSQPPGYGSQPPGYGSQPPGYGSQPPPPPQYAPGQYGGVGGYRAAPETDQTAILSLVISLVGLVICWPAGIASLILGFNSLRKIDASGGALGGRGLAIAGIAVSVVDILITIGVVIFVIVALAAAGGSATYSY
jgi:hypothetical protein